MTETTFGLAPEPRSTEEVAPTAAPRAPQAKAKLSLLDQIRADAQKGLAQIKTYDVPTRPGYKVTFDANVEKDDVDRWQRNAQKRKKSDDIDTLKMASQALVESCVGIYYHGEQVFDTESDPMTLGNNEWLEIWGGGDSLQAVKQFMGDGTAQTMGLSLLKEAGYGDGSDLDIEDGAPENPTRG